MVSAAHQSSENAECGPPAAERIVQLRLERCSVCSIAVLVESVVGAIGVHAGVSVVAIADNFYVDNTRAASRSWNRSQRRLPNTRFCCEPNEARQRAQRTFVSSH